MREKSRSVTPPPPGTPSTSYLAIAKQAPALVKEPTELRKLLDVDDIRLALVLASLAEQLESQGRGIRLQRLDTQIQLVSAPENARYIAALLGLPMSARLTTAAMETLASETTSRAAG